MKPIYNNLNLITLSITGAFLILLGLGIYSQVHLRPDNIIIGTWEETDWQYVKIDDENNNLIAKMSIDEVQKEIISRGLLIHKYEKWIFNKNGVLIIRKKDSDDIMTNWVLKGRGSVLKISYENDLYEYYQIKELSRNKMSLHFDNDAHVRGIVKIEFKKSK